MRKVVNVITGKTQLAGVLGWPVSHTKSPVMQNAAFAAAGMDAAYLPLPVKPEHIGEAVKGLRALGFVGANVTVPHKQAVIPYLDEFTPAARIVGAVNTIRVEKDGKLTGDNTDCVGAVRALEADGATLKGKTAVVLGAGGAGRGVAAGCALAGARKVVILNRTVARARKLAEELQQTVEFNGVVFEFGSLDEGCDWKNVDFVLQMTSLGMNGQGSVPWGCDRVPAHCHVLDAVYHPLETAFLAEARARGLKTTDGLSMLLEQGAAAFEFWFHITPDRAAMRSALAAATAEDRQGHEIQ